MKKSAGVLGAVLSAVLALTAAAPARAASWLEMNFYLFGGPRYDAWLPACDNPLALAKIDIHFVMKELRFWTPGLFISQFGEVREVAYRPWGEHAIPRRFCVAKTLMSDGTETVTYYSIVEDQGFAGAAFGVEWCVMGYDRNMAYSPRCKMAQP
ncbi:MAG TPA: hypothetical protein VKT73_06060 [Xanthobacteraceae bacterium]|nr:hypothetical protein [Xanthobacteraceae bacterium]